jgi:hypothetical protein
MMFGTSTKEIKKEEIQKKILKLQQLIDLFNDGSHMICVFPNEFKYAIVTDK